ncbi:MAG: DegT/DnrJ/EryC1/StrS family aminotransferase [Fermentimonas sp.]|nr:DegT/DnrJ/EryC1/StrS family aminotransferase [Fermentimonas sp.]
MITYDIPQMEPWIGDEERNAVNDYMRSGGWLTEFKLTKRFEDMIAEYTGAKHCIVVNNGTISLTMAALACGVSAGDEVIVPNYTMIATPNSIKLLGATPVFVDIEPSTLCMDVHLAKKAVTPKTKAIMLVLANGRYPEAGIDAFMELSQETGIPVIEDAAQSLGSRYPNGVHQGLMGKVGSFSFSAPKIITTGQGGALVTNDDELAFKLRRLKDFGRSGGGNDIHDTIGFNFKFTEMQACIGIEQMKKLQWRVDRKKDIYRLYQQELDNVSGVSFFDQDLANTTPWFIDILAIQRGSLEDFLKQRGIGTRDMYPPINCQKAYHVGGDYPVSKMIGTNGLWLPSSSQLSNEMIKYVCSIIKDWSQNGK